MRALECLSACVRAKRKRLAVHFSKSVPISHLKSAPTVARSRKRTGPSAGTVATVEQNWIETGTRRSLSSHEDNTIWLGRSPRGQLRRSLPIQWGGTSQQNSKWTDARTRFDFGQR